jgi:transcriptional regulator with XRE-family HTH domain
MMILDPKAWRLQAGLTLASVARAAGIEGRNPAKTYSRYEQGESACPAEIVERLRALSQGQLGAESFHAVRLTWLRSNAAPVPAEACHAPP